MSRIAARFAALRREGRGALIPFLEAYDPDYATSMDILRGMPGAGADLIEIGMPFTDPMADGPTIQAAGLRGLKAGATLARTLAMVREFRAGDADTPVILMGYLNPIASYGPERFCRDASAAGVDGLIVVDLPTEEADLLAGHAHASASTSSALSPPPRTTPASPSCCTAAAASSTTSASPASPAPAVPRRRAWPPHCPASAP